MEKNIYIWKNVLFSTVKSFMMVKWDCYKIDLGYVKHGFYLRICQLSGLVVSGKLFNSVKPCCSQL